MAGTAFFIMNANDATAGALLLVLNESFQPLIFYGIKVINHADIISFPISLVKLL